LKLFEKSIMGALVTVAVLTAALGAAGVNFQTATAVKGGVPNEVNNRINYCYTYDFIEVPTGELRENAGACGETKKSCEVNRLQTAATDTTTVRVVRVDDSCSMFKEDVTKPNHNPE
jgi:hypothetical protein